MVAELTLEQRQAYADELAPIADELAERIRREHPDVLYAEHLAHRSHFELACLVLLAVAADDASVDPEVRWGWVRYRDVLEHPSPIVWPEDHLPIEELDSEQINGLIERRTARGETAAEIAEAVGLPSARAAAKRLERRRATAAKAGVA